MHPTDPNLVVKPAVALGMSLTVACGANAQLQIQTHAERDGTEAERNAALDTLYEAGVRVQRRFAIASCHDQIRAKLITLAQQHEIFAAAQRTFEADRDSRRRQAAGLQEDDEAHWAASGRHGEYKPRADIATKVKSLRDQEKQHTEEREQARRSHEGFVASAGHMIQTWEAEIQALQEALDGVIRE